MLRALRAIKHIKYMEYIKVYFNNNKYKFGLNVYVVYNDIGECQTIEFKLNHEEGDGGGCIRVSSKGQTIQTTTHGQHTSREGRTRTISTGFAMHKVQCRVRVDLPPVKKTYKDKVTDDIQIGDLHKTDFVVTGPEPNPKILVEIDCHGKVLYLWISWQSGVIQIDYDGPVSIERFKMIE